MLCIFCLIDFSFAVITFDSNGQWNTSFPFEWPGNPVSLTTLPENNIGITHGGGWDCGDCENESDKHSRFVPEANNPIGSGNGFRHPLGYNIDVNGTYDRGNGGGFSVNFPEKYKELWIRYYIRFEEGMTWGGHNGYTGYLPYYFKQLYLYAEGSEVIIGFYPSGSGKFGFETQSTDSSMRSVSNTKGWDDIDDSNHEGTGEWHSYGGIQAIVE